MGTSSASAGSQSVNGPWMKTRRWASGRIYDQTRKFAIASAIFTIIFASLTGLTTYGIVSDPKHDPGLWVMPILFGAITLAMGTWTVRQIMVSVKFGRSVLELETLPGVIGGWFAGTIRSPVIFEADKGVKLTLQCCTIQ